MSIKALLTAFLLLALPLNGFAQVTGGSTAGTTPGTTPTKPGTAQTIPGTTGTIPGTTQMPPATTTLPDPTTDLPRPTSELPRPTTILPSPTTQLPPPTTQTPPATTGSIPGTTDFSQDNTNITGRFETSPDRGSVFDTLDDGMGITGGEDSIFVNGRFGNNTSFPGNGTSSGLDDEDEFATGLFPETPDTLDNGVFENDLESPMNDSVLR